MPDEAIVSKRSMTANIIAAICVITALMQTVAAVLMLNEAGASAELAGAGNATLLRIFLPLLIAIGIKLVAGVAVYRMRLEALACMGYLLAGVLAALINRRAPLSAVGDLVLLLALIFFTMRLFLGSTTRRPPSKSGWQHPAVMLLLGLAAGNLQVFALAWPAYPELLATGSVSILMALLALIGCCAFYAATLLMRSRPARAKIFFLLGAVAMGLSLPGWHIQYSFSTPFWLGVPLALFGFGLAQFLHRRQARNALEKNGLETAA